MDLYATVLCLVDAFSGGLVFLSLLVVAVGPSYFNNNQLGLISKVFLCLCLLGVAIS